MKKHLSMLILLVAMVLPWTTRAQSPGDLVSTFPYSCDFESASVSGTWVTVNGTQYSKWYIGTAVNATSGGTTSLYVSADNGVTNGYASDPSNTGTGAASYTWAYQRFTFAAGVYDLSFVWRNLGEFSGDPYDFFRVFIVPDDVTLTAGALPSTSYTWSNQFMSDVPTGWIGINNGSLTYFVDDSVFSTASAEFTISTAGNYKLVFLWLNDDNTDYPPAAAIDDIEIDVSACPAPQNLTFVSLDENGISISWTPMGTENSWAVFVDGQYEGTATSSSYTITNPAQGSNVITVAALCGSDTSLASAPISVFVAADAVSTFPYITGFEDGEDDAWEFVNDVTNKWYVGTGAHNTGTHGLYISNDNGTSNSYTNSATQFSYAYRTLNVTTAGQFAITFDWRANGESSWDYLRAWIAPASAVSNLSAGHSPDGGTSSYSYTTTTPTGWVDLGGKMNLQTSWQTTLATPTLGTGSYMLVFMWANDGSGGTTPPAAIDNININVLTCPLVSALTASNVVSDGFDLNWTAGGSESEWLITANDSVLGTSNVNSYSVTGLTSNTVYNVKVYAVCGANDTSMATAISVRTACGDLTSLPVTYNFDDQATGSSADFVYCWNRYNSTATYMYYPYITSNSSNAHSGDNCLYFYLYTSSDYPDTIYTILPQVDSNTYQIEDLEVLFWGKTTSSSYHPIFEVGVYVDLPDTTYFYPVDTVSVTYAAGLAEYSVQFAGYDGPQGRIAFRYLKSMMCATYSYCYLYMDDVTIREVNNCLVPTNLVANAANADSVYITWSEAGDATEWELVYGLPGFNPDTVNTDSIISCSDSVQVLTGLTGGTSYQVYVRAVCSDGSSYWAGPVAFTPGSIIMGTSGSATMYVCGAVIYDNGGPTGQYQNSSDYTLTLYPNDDTKRFKFWGSGSAESCCDYLRIYAGATAGGTLLASIVGDNIVIDTVTTQGGPITLQFHSDGSVVRDGYVIHIACEDLPPCRDIDEVEVVEVSAGSAYITWSNAVGTTPLPSSYIVTVTDTAGVAVTSVTTSDMFAMVSGLTPNSDYTVSVVPACDESNGMPAAADFTTAGFGCLQVDTTLAFSDTIGNGTSTSTYLPSYSFYNYGLTQQIFTAAEIGHGGQIDNFSFKMSAVSQQRTYEIYMGHTNVSTSSDFLHPADLTCVYNGGPVTLTANQWTTFNLTTPFNYNGTDNLVIILRDMTGSYVSGNAGYVHSAPSDAARYAYQDSGPYDPNTYSGGYSLSVRNNIILGGAPCAVQASCAAPLMVVTGKTDSSVSIMWAAGSTETSWTVEHKALTDAAWTVDYATTSNTDLTVTGLLANTTYQFRVYHLCGTDTFATVRTVTTDCAGTPVPFFENFATWSTGTAAAAPSCWFKGSNYSASYPYITTGNSMPGDNNSVYFYASGTTYTYLALPKMAAPIDTLVVTGYVKYSSAGYYMNIGVMTDATDFATFHPVSGVSTVANQWVPFEVSFAGQPEGNIAFSVGNGGSYAYLYLDNVSVNYFNPCVRPTGVTASGITVNSANISWVDTATTNFELEYGPSGFTPGTGTILSVTGNTQALTGLNHSSRYDVYVRGICGVGDTSDRSFVYSFATTCAPIDVLPFTENFDNWGTGSNVHAPNCWTYNSDYSTTYPYITSNATHGGVMYMYDGYTAGSTNKTWFALPALDSATALVNQTQIIFSASAPNTSYEHPVMVGVGNTSYLDASVVWIDTIVPAYNVWNEYEVAFDTYTGTGRFIFFATHIAGSYAYSYPYIDDITLELIPTCRRPNQLSATNATPNSVDLQWNERSGATQWQIEYGPQGFTPGTGTVVTVSANPFTLTGLTPGFQGEFRVRSICSATDTGDYSRGLCGFATSQIPATLPYNYNFEDPAEWSNWQVSSNNPNVNWYRGTAVADSGSYSLYISADTGATYRPYDYNAVTNVAAYRDIDFGAIDSSYTISFRARVGGTISANYDGLMVFLVDPSLPTAASNNNITSPWGNVNNLYRIATVRRDTTWQTYEASFDTIHGIHRVAFFWFNQNTGASYPNLIEPAAVDNIHIDYSSCPRPLNLDTLSVGGSAATLTWTGEAGANYEVVYRQVGGTNQFAYASTNSITITGLASAAEHVAWVRKFCGAGDTSLYSDGFTFYTKLCDGATTVATGDPDSTSSTSYYAPVNNYYNYTLSETIIDSAELGGPLEISTIAYYYDYATASTDKTNVDIWLQPTNKTAFSSSSDIVALDTATAVLVYSGALNCEQGWNFFAFTTPYSYDGNGNLLVIVDDNSGDYNGSSYVFKTMPTSQYKTLTWYSDTYNPDINNLGASYSGTKTYYQWRPVMQLISCGGSCSAPAVSVTNVDYQGANVTAAGNGMSFELVYGTDIAAMGDTMTNATGNFTLTGLTPDMQYFVGVRQQCDSVTWSNWTIANFTTDELPCFTPTNLEVTATAFSGATLHWTSAGSATQWVVETNGAGNQRFDTVGTNPYTVTGLYANTQYTASVRAICMIGVVESDWSDTITFTTDACPTVEGIAVSAVTSSGATASWQSANGALGYRLTYGEEGFLESEADRVDIASGTTSYTFSGLLPETEYEFYVQTKCGDDIYSNVTGRTSFVTLSSSQGIYDVESGTLTLFPNPASSNVTVTVSGFEGEVTVEIVDLNGKRVAEQRTQNSELTIDVTAMAQGAYFVRVTGERQTVVRKLIVR